MKAPTPSRTPSLGTHWLTVARVPGVTFALAALLLPSAAAAGLAPYAAPELLDLEAPLIGTDSGPRTDTAATAGPVEETPAAPAPAEEGGFTTGQRLTPDQIEWFRAHAESLQAEGVLRGHAVYASWS